MSIVVKGMEIPKNCTHCDSIGLNVAIGCPVMTGINGRATDCPLVEIPEKHGRLIDEDDCFKYMTTNNAPAWEVLKYAPTVIEAEEQE